MSVRPRPVVTKPFQLLEAWTDYADSPVSKLGSTGVDDSPRKTNQLPFQVQLHMSRKHMAARTWTAMHG